MISKIETLAKKNVAKIAIGVSDNPRQRSVTVAGAEQAEKRGLVEPILVGNEVDSITKLETVNTTEASSELVNLLLTNQVDGIVRGSLFAGDFIKNLLNCTQKNREEIIKARFALVQSSVSNKTFIISPIGIDEGFNVEEKEFIVVQGSKFLNNINLKPNISVMAAGTSPKDLGRHPIADKTITESEAIIKKYSNEIPITSDGILIDKSLSRGANFILSIDGITGNIIYRTLINLSQEWLSFGALFKSNIPELEGKIIVDTSQFASLHDYRRSLIFASALR